MFRFPLWIEIDGVLRNCFLEGKKSLMYSELSCRKLFIISKQYKIEIISKDPPLFLKYRQLQTCCNDFYRELSSNEM